MFDHVRNGGVVGEVIRFPHGAHPPTAGGHVALRPSHPSIVAVKAPSHSRSADSVTTRVCLCRRGGGGEANGEEERGLNNW